MLFFGKSFVLITAIMVSRGFCARQTNGNRVPQPFQILSYYRGNYLQPRIEQQPQNNATSTAASFALHGTQSRTRNKKHRNRRLKTTRLDRFDAGRRKQRGDRSNENDLRFRFRSRARDTAGRANDAKGYHNLYHKDETYKVEKFYDDDYSDRDYHKRIGNI